MNNKFDELAKSLAQSGTRRAAFKRFGVGLAGMALACFGLANKAKAAKNKCYKWECVDPVSGFSYAHYVCGGGPPNRYTYGHCQRIGVVDCSYCYPGCC